VELPEDAAGLHYGAFEGGQLLSVVSLFIDGAAARFRKFATEPAEQGRGIGSALLRYLMKEAAGHGARRLWCDARQEKAGFYQKFGFRVEGELFYKGPIPYVRMSCALPEAAS
jgi:GNAT superfamily N-acetyltransferase